MKREFHVRFCEGGRVRFPSATRRLHARESAPLGSGWKRGEQKQAVGRSRGGRNTKIHALADVKGRLIAILLTTVEAHDCPVAERLVRKHPVRTAEGLVTFFFSRPCRSIS
jgi:hypothetical protein